MSAKDTLPRPAVARAEARGRKRGSQRARAAKTAAAKAQRRVAREKTGALRDTILRPSTLKKYLQALTQFFLWMKSTGRQVPGTIVDLDAMFCVWADHLYAEGDMKCILNSAFCGAAHTVPQMREFERSMEALQGLAES